jgi:hypothetical protein
MQVPAYIRNISNTLARITQDGSSMSSIIKIAVILPCLVKTLRSYDGLKHYGSVSVVEEVFQMEDILEILAITIYGFPMNKHYQQL